MRKRPLDEILLGVILVVGAFGAALSALAIFAALGASLYAALFG